MLARHCNIPSLVTWKPGRGAAAEAEADAVATGGCVLCQNPDFLRDGFGERTMIICDQCEREFHVGCLARTGRAHLSELPEGAARQPCWPRVACVPCLLSCMQRSSWWSVGSWL